jgi:clan AA aspartic protease
MGFVDESLRALVEVPVSASEDAEKQLLSCWIDTAFNGGLVIPRRHVEELELKQSSMTKAVLADGTIVELETFTCYLEWFGSTYRTQVAANEGEFPLLGTMLLADRRLTVDYTARNVSLD